MGIQIMAFFARPDKGSKILKYWNWYHYWFGRIAIFFGNINIVLEIQIGNTGNEWKAGCGFLLGTVLIATIVLEALSRKRRLEKRENLPAFQMNTLQYYLLKNSVMSFTASSTLKLQGPSALVQAIDLIRSVSIKLQDHTFMESSNRSIIIMESKNARKKAPIFITEKFFEIVKKL
ncbi:hypothetical protein Acr_14g0006440 [Actinidia rufa]|uniref:Cytochrome b561 domain-containing protein n=1 Tax=Actinidia rufa TaxID=165716 RepID=A0A7J0FQK9_9ERIC|nr:hypothetical protein Acr_14g0006440 [Actinidia rufa]